MIYNSQPGSGNTHTNIPPSNTQSRWGERLQAGPVPDAEEVARLPLPL